MLEPTFVRANFRVNQQLHIPSCTLNLHGGYYFSTLFPTFLLTFYHNQWFWFKMKHTSVLYFSIFWKSKKPFGQWFSCFTCACLLKIFAVWFCINLYLPYHSCLDDNPPGNKTSWQRRNDDSLLVPATSQVRPKWNIQRRLDGTSLRRLSGRYPRKLIGASWRRLKRM